MTLDFINSKQKLLHELSQLTFSAVSLEITVLLTLLASMSNPNICEILPLKSPIQFNRNGGEPSKSLLPALQTDTLVL